MKLEELGELFSDLDSELKAKEILTTQIREINEELKSSDGLRQKVLLRQLRCAETFLITLKQGHNYIIDLGVL